MPWELPDALVAHSHSTTLESHGALLHNLNEPELVIRKKGRPFRDLNADQTRRATAFMEDLQKQAGAQKCLNEATVGAAAVKNPGGKGVRRPIERTLCSKCGERGHRRNSCTNPSRMQRAAMAIEADEWSDDDDFMPSGVVRGDPDVARDERANIRRREDDPEAPENVDMHAEATSAIGEGHKPTPYRRGHVPFDSVGGAAPAGGVSAAAAAADVNHLAARTRARAHAHARARARARARTRTRIRTHMHVRVCTHACIRVWCVLTYP